MNEIVVKLASDIRQAYDEKDGIKLHRLDTVLKYMSSSKEFRDEWNKRIKHDKEETTESAPTTG